MLVCLKKLKIIWIKYIPINLLSVTRDSPWVNKKSKYLVNLKNKVYKLYCSSKDIVLCNKLQDLRKKLAKPNVDSKKKYYSHMSLKQVDPRSSPKMFESILKHL